MNNLQCWSYYRHFVSWPFEETVSVGDGSYQVHFSREEELLQFLQSDASLYMYVISQLDLANIANMFGMNIAVFTYHCRNGDNPRWTWTYPDQTPGSPFFHSPHVVRAMNDMWLYHEELDCC